MNQDRRITLTVERAFENDVSYDVARIHWQYRHDDDDGQIWRISINNKMIPLSVRGLVEERPIIRLDNTTRDKFRVKVGDEILVGLGKASLFNQVSWGWKSSNVLNRVAIRIALVSLFLGVLGLLLGVLSLFNSF